MLLQLLLPLRRLLPCYDDDTKRGRGQGSRKAISDMESDTIVTGVVMCREAHNKDSRKGFVP